MELWKEFSILEKGTLKISKYEGFLPNYILKSCGIDLSSVQYSIISNPNQKSYFIASVFDGQRNLINLNILNEDKIGSINSITKVISNDYGNILLATAIIESHEGNNCHFFTLVELEQLNKLKNLINELSKLPSVNKVIIQGYSLNIESKLMEVKKYDNVKILKIKSSYIDNLFFKIQNTRIYGLISGTKNSVLSDIISTIIIYLLGVFSKYIYNWILTFIS